mgnify:CR=1 FL=1
MRDGGCVAIGSVLKSLLQTKSFSVFHFTISTKKHPFDIENYPKTWREHMDIDHCQLNTQTDLLGAMYYLLKNESYNLARFKQKKLKRKIEDLLKDHSFDIVICESIYTLPFVDLFIQKGCKVILRAHNIEHEIWRQLAAESSFKLKKWYFNKLADQLEAFESEHTETTDS